MITEQKINLKVRQTEYNILKEREIEGKELSELERRILTEYEKGLKPYKTLMRGHEIEDKI